MGSEENKNGTCIFILQRCNYHDPNAAVIV
jgi:hypothetical protein